MTMTEAELQDLLQKNPALHVRGDALRPKPPKIARPKPMFDSQAEERYYNAYIAPGIYSGLIRDCRLHRTFEIIPAVEHWGKKYPACVYTPDFVVCWRDGLVEVIEIKGKVITRRQRDYHLRRQLFIFKYCNPNGWRFREIRAEEI